MKLKKGEDAMKRGFTLVELIVVVIIIGILAAVGIPQYRKALERSRGAEALSALGHIQEAEKIYFATEEAYLEATAPMATTEQRLLDISLPQTNWEIGVVVDNVVSPPTFTATATRDGGPCDGDVITIDNTGSLVQDDWRACVDAL